jgi:hypothetical protein
MGKKLRQTNVSGLSRFLQAFNEPGLSQGAIAGPSTPRLKREPESDFVDSLTRPAVGKGLLGPGNEAYDATGLVPFYTDASQVPAHLQKCAYYKQKPVIHCIKHSELTHKSGEERRFRSADAIFFEVRRGLLVRRGRVVQRDTRGDRYANSREVSLRRHPRRVLWRWRQCDRLCPDVSTRYESLFSVVFFAC